jgi:hypothetical protein
VRKEQSMLRFLLDLIARQKKKLVSGTPRTSILEQPERLPSDEIIASRFPLPQGSESSIAMWVTCQNLLKIAERWDHYREEEPLLMRQTGNQHVLSLLFTYMQIHSFLCQRGFQNKIDLMLMFQCFYFHDWGEPLANGDVPDYDKTTKGNVEEYKAFSDFIDKMICDPAEATQIKRAFLLQYCIDQKTLERNPDRKLFPNDAQVMMEELYVNHRLEALLFCFTEQLDYFYYVIFGYKVVGYKRALKSVCMFNASVLNRVLKEIPVLAEKFWTEEFQQQVTQFLLEYPDLDPHPPKKED